MLIETIVNLLFGLDAISHVSQICCAHYLLRVVSCFILAVGFRHSMQSIVERSETNYDRLRYKVEAQNA